MKIKHLTYFFIAFLLVFASCEKDKDNDNEKETLYVKFGNDQASEYTISNIQLRARGDAGTTEEITPGEWGGNILKDGKTIAPGAYEFFTLEIPNLEWSEYRLGVLVNGNEVMLHEQAGYTQGYQPSITHWGGDDRTTGVTIKYDQTSDLIYINGYSDWVGID